ncbi:MAG: hypothetical protein PHC54_00435 [Candidatus Omnitrophica bacterium]|nr:hypothetical protein [Candidatus Omnitrophota bacterium]MDD5591956.1 hypothetical protein [Candidatus Omnitrophota bacterium]
MIIIFLMNLLVGISAFLLNYRILKFVNFVDSLLSLFILYFTQIVFTELLLGITGALSIGNLILLNLAIAAVIWLATINKKSFFGLTDIKTVLCELLSNKIILFLVTLISVFACVKIFINLVNPPFGWDSLNYHFTFPVEWLKHANLKNPITIFDDPAPSYYPINGSLFYLWLIFPLRNVFLADLGQLPFFVLAFLAAYNISRKLGVSRESSFYAATLFLLIPNFFKQLSLAYVDVMVAALFLVSLNYLFLLNKESCFKNILLYAMSMGLLVGTKTIALPYAALLFLPFIFLCIKKAQKSYLFIASILVIITLGGFSYIRNFIETGNPFYPLDVKLLGQAIFKGVIDISSYRAHFKIEDYRLTKLLFHEGLGAQSLIFILPFIFLALPLIWIKKKKAPDLYLAYFLILPLLIYSVYRYIIPLANTRYLYPLLGTGMIIGFYTLKDLNIPRRIVNILVVICALASIPELAKRQELVASILLTFFLFVLSLLLIRKRIVINRFVIYLFFIFLILLLIFIQGYYLKNEYPGYIKMAKYSGFWPQATAAWNWLNSNTEGNNIAYAGRPVPFPLYGASFKNNVYYVSVNKVEPAKLHYFSGSYYKWGDDFLSLHKNLEAKGNYRADTNYPVWLDNLRERNTDYLFIYSLHQTRDIAFPIEDSWAKANPDKFALVFENNAIHIYKILR